MIAAADPSRTEILGNYRMDYRKNPVQCPEASWAEHIFTPDHMQSECDPHLWSQVETMVRQRLLAAETVAATSTRPPPECARNLIRFPESSLP